METRELRHAHPGAQLKLPGVKLTVIEGPDRGREVVARRGVIRVGSAADADLTLRDDAISRRHLQLKLRADEVRVIDLDSTNGTYIDGVRVLEAILAPGSLIRLGATVIRVSPVSDPVVVPISNRGRFGGLLGRSLAMRQVFSVLERAAPSEATILIEGETGTGKEVAAEAIHANSPRAEGPFVAIDCGAIAPTLVESELFGHVKGAFTGAISDRKGAFEEANGGTLFLDELGELPLDLQPKLLRALETRQIKRVGSTAPLKVDVRVVAATNRDLAAEINRGGFREDLYFRLAVVQVSLPPLRARREDIPELVRHFVKRFAPSAPPLGESTMQALASQPWPGNVRELAHVIERAVLMSDGALIRNADLGLDATDHGPERFEDMTLEDAERILIHKALARCRGNVSHAATALGLSRSALYRRLEKFGTTPTDES